MENELAIEHFSVVYLRSNVVHLFRSPESGATHQLPATIESSVFSLRRAKMAASLTPSGISNHGLPIPIELKVQLLKVPLVASTNCC